MTNVPPAPSSVIAMTFGAPHPASWAASAQMRQAHVAGTRMDTERLRWPLAYLAGWLSAGLLVAALTVAVLGHGGPPSPGVAVPPVREIALTSAARMAGCAVDARRAPRAAAAGAPRPGGRIYDEPVSAGLRERALRSGLIVIEYRADVTGRPLDTLKALQQAVPTGTILAPSRAGLRFALAAPRFAAGCAARG